IFSGWMAARASSRLFGKTVWGAAILTRTFGGGNRGGANDKLLSGAPPEETKREATSCTMFTKHLFGGGMPGRTLPESLSLPSADESVLPRERNRPILGQTCCWRCNCLEL